MDLTDLAGDRSIKPATFRTGGDFHIVEVGVDPYWVEALLGPLSDEEAAKVLTMPHGTRWSDIGGLLQLFKSKGDAMRNGWDGEVQPGFAHRVLKKKGIHVWVIALMPGINDTAPEAA